MIMELNATTRLKATDISNFDDHPGKQKAETFTNSLEKSLKKVGFRATVSPNKLLNRKLSGPNKGYFFTLMTDASFDECSAMMEEAGWSRKSRGDELWVKRGQQSFWLAREGESSIFFV